MPVSGTQFQTSQAVGDAGGTEPTPSREPLGWRAPPVLETIQTVITALILAFVFRAFWVEAFIIPTGSMAQTLLGAHATITCTVCGWEFDYTPGRQCLCPNCHAVLEPDPVLRKAGDRILVHKWTYVLGGLFGPRRWDVIVFRNPSDPEQNYIKRLIGLPGEAVEILDGDVFIDGRIARKTPAAQQVLWFPVFDQRYFPRGDVPAAAAPRWVKLNPGDGPDSGWSGLTTRLVRHRAGGGREHVLAFQPPDPRYGQDVYAYNGGPSAWPAPFVNDLRVLAEVTFRGGEGTCRWEILHDDRRFEVRLERDGTARLAMADAEGAWVTLGHAALGRFREARPYVVEVGHLDYRVYFKLDGREILATTEEQYHPDVTRLRSWTRQRPVALRIAARDLDLDLRGLRVERDVYYTYREGYTRRAYAGHLFVLKDDEYFVLGDNSPDSRDSREWVAQGPHLPPGRYQVGTVPEDQIVGPAAFVYLPGLLPRDRAGHWHLPDLGRVRFIR